ncbi:MAG: rhomboid family intramembrane serine protease [Acinetobacter sp.]|uniref:rhomboid family intramembrane serine protease n=1 Tax=Acinetobacter sp. TaxID=472 RepID=UPI0026DB7257|nr:rhomboid family intramembrane serine protease [Acinetobacter sp.]MDO4580278.1 rhomboid family intramembrane serine protease [Acinetobacter sp.]
MSEYSPPLIHHKPETHLWWLTALLIALNIGVFAWQILTGVDASQPSTRDAILWGADYAPLTFLEQPQRLFSSMFFHFGMIHLMLNMWALYIFGSVAEQLFGRLYFLGLYILAGLMGSLLSGYLQIQDSLQILAHGLTSPDLLPSVSAGASGAVMGLGASLTVLSLLPRLPKQRFLLDKKTLLLVMGLNLFMGFMISGINNAAHIGGMVMGAALAALWYIGQKLHKSALFSLLALTGAAIISWLFYQYCLQQVQMLAPLWQEILQMMRQQLQL